MVKGKALKRALQAKDGFRINGKIPLIQDTTEFITPEIAEKMLRKNKKNRPINWNKVEEYRKQMEAGEWGFHAQGIILDDKGNILTGQKRLWAIIYHGEGQYMRVSRGSPANTAHLLDRGAPQTSRDLASRSTERRHSPTEASIVRGVYALQGLLRPSADQIADGMVKYEKVLERMMKQTRGIKKGKSMLMILAAACASERGDIESILGKIEMLASDLEAELHPIPAEKCWNRGAAFSLAMEKANIICEMELNGGS